MLKETRARKTEETGRRRRVVEGKEKEGDRSCEGAEATGKQVFLTDSYGTRTKHTLTRAYAHKYRNVV